MYKTNKFIANTYTKSIHKHHAPSNQCFLEKMTAADSFYNGCDERSTVVSVVTINNYYSKFC